MQAFYDTRNDFHMEKTAFTVLPTKFASLMYSKAKIN